MKTNLEFCNTINDITNRISLIDTDCLLLVIDVNISLLYKDELACLTKTPDKKVLIYKTIAGENLKCLKEFEKCSNYFLEAGIHRKAHLVSIGGGVTSDFAGFVASTLLRGIAWSNVPTTLLSMVDASIGGKVGVNAECGKNLIGAFHNPVSVWTCHKFLRTLLDVDMRSGKGEILKYAFLDEEIGQFIKSKDYNFYKLINLCAEYKLQLTQRDSRELGLRKILNLGHTFGHAVEKHYLLPHGQSVVLGMIIVFLITNDEKSLENLREYAQAIQLGDCEIPWHNRSFPLEELFLYITKDKKVNSLNSIDLIVVEDNKPVIQKIAIDLLKETFKGKKDELKKILL